MLGSLGAAVVLLVPNQRPAGVGLPVGALGLLGLAWLGRWLWEALRLNPRTDPNRPVTWAIFAVLLLTYGALVAAGVGLLTARTAPLYWLAGINASLLTSAMVGTWVLLSHARAAPP
jgi:hypothetical protein